MLPQRASRKTTPAYSRGRELLAAMAQGLTVQESGKALGISPFMVEKLHAGLRARLGVHNAT